MSVQARITPPTIGPIIQARVSSRLSKAFPALAGSQVGDVTDSLRPRYPATEVSLSHRGQTVDREVGGAGGRIRAGGAANGFRPVGVQALGGHDPVDRARRTRDPSLDQQGPEWPMPHSCLACLKLIHGGLREVLISLLPRGETPSLALLPGVVAGARDLQQLAHPVDRQPLGLSCGLLRQQRVGYALGWVFTAQEAEVFPRKSFSCSYGVIRLSAAS